MVQGRAKEKFKLKFPDCAARVCKGLAKLGNIAVKTLLRAQMFPSLATRETLLRMLQLTQMLHPQHMFPSLATEETSQETMFHQQCLLV